jgi:hypothetical protein
MAIGLMKDKPDTLIAAAIYLEQAGVQRRLPA